MSLVKVHFTQNAYENEKARQVGNQIDQVKGVLIQNIGESCALVSPLTDFGCAEAIIDRREKIEIIVDKTEALKATSLQFRQVPVCGDATFLWVHGLVPRHVPYSVRSVRIMTFMFCTV